MHGGHRPFPPGLDCGFKLHALDHDKCVPGRNALAFGDMNRNDHTRHRRFGNIVGAAGRMTAVALHRIKIAKRKGRSVDVNVNEIAVGCDEDAWSSLRRR